MFSDWFLSSTARTYSPAFKRWRSNSRLDFAAQRRRVFTLSVRKPATRVS
jgi:hypothetical protein